MAALFTRTTNTIFRLVLVLLGILLLGSPVALILAARTPYVTGQDHPVEQPVFFDHRHHVGDDGIDCRYCHDLVERSAYAGIPPTERCLNCHSQIWNESPLLAPVWESYETDRPIPWIRVHALPDFVYFDHSVHIKGGIGCVSCHGRVDRMARIVQVSPLTMQWCLACHRNPEPHQRPQAWITAMVARVPDAALRNLPLVSPGTNCTTCHR